MKSEEPGVARIVRLAGHAERRARLSRSLGVTSSAMSLALAVCIVGVALRKVELLGEVTARVILVASFAGALGAGVAAWLWRLPEHAGARALDRFYDLHDRLANALAFAARPVSDRTPFMAAAVEDATLAARELRPRAAVPIRAPRALLASAALGAILVGVLSLEVRRHVPVARTATLVPIDVSPDDIDDVKDFLAQLASRSPSEETKVAIEELNRLLSDIANERLDRTEAFRRIEALEMKLAADAPVDREGLDRELLAMGEELSKAELSRPVGAALRNADVDKARDALHELAKKVRSSAGPADKAKLDELRDALKKAAERASASRSALERRRDQLADEIDRLKQQTADGGSDEERSRLHKDQQELERLDRQLEEQGREGAQLERLDRELGQAAEDLARDLGLTSRDLEQGAEDLNRLREQQLSQQEKEALRQRLTELRELLRQQAAGGKGQLKRLKRFGRMARGQLQGGGSEGHGTGEGTEETTPGDETGAPKDGSQGLKDGQVWVLGPGGEKILMLTEGRSGSGEGPSEGPPRPGDRGEGHDPHVQGAPTNAKMATQDTEVQGTETGQGGSRSQVILGAAARGFSSRSYRKVFTEYHQVAEESLAHDEIPGGYRFYVKRYFQLIRPREEP
jgi:hypothetical protein